MPQPVQIGVLLPRLPDDLGEWLADGAAFDAAGADALWIDLAPESPFDPLALTTALATVTYRSLLVTAPAAEAAGPRTLTTVERLGNGRLRWRTGGAFDDWAPVPLPDGRAAWRATVQDAAERGCPGVVVPAGPRLLTSCATRRIPASGSISSSPRAEPIGRRRLFR